MEHFFWTDMTLPMSTFALGIGYWQSHTIVKTVECKTACSNEPPNICTTAHDPYPCHVARGDTGPLIPCKILYSVSAQNVPHPSWLKPGLATNTFFMFAFLMFAFSYFVLAFNHASLNLIFLTQLVLSGPLEVH